MLAGKLNKRVWIQRMTEATSAGGAPVEKFDDWIEVAAAIEPLQPREFLAAAAVNSDITIKIRMRKRQVDATMRIRWTHGPGSPQVTELFDIEGPPIEVETNSTEMWLMCKRRDTVGFRTGEPKNA